MELFLIRHGEAEHNLNNVFAGGKVDDPLTTHGRKNTAELAKSLSNIRLDVIYCSSLKRSLESSKIIQEELEGRCGRKIPIISLALLDEIDVGCFAGLDRREVLAKHPSQAMDFYSGDVEKWSFPSGELHYQAKARAEKLLELIKKDTNRSVLIVGHSMMNKVLFGLVKDIKVIKKSQDLHMNIYRGKI